jgi:FemAB-related protein (PEP-CTERM system-associated)
MRIVRYSTADPAWNGFVERDPRAFVFHLLEWRRIITRAYGHESYYLVAEENGQLQGVLPLFLIRSWLFGRSLVSLPFADYGGICAQNPAAATALLQEALKIGATQKADYLQLRDREPLATVSGIPGDKVTMLLRLGSDPQTIWSHLPSERRNRIKKAQQKGVTGRLVGLEGLAPFYRVFAENMRDIGSPVHKLEFFRAVLEELGPRARVLLVERTDEVIGGAFCLFFRDTIYIPWVSSLRQHFALNPNMVLYWTAIEYGCRQGYETLDFGRSSKGTGTFEFKRQWGATPLPLAWNSFPLRGHTVPTFSGQGLKERFFVECWKRLPVGLSQRLGPRVRGLIPA